MFMKKVFICSPYRGDIGTNTQIARYAARIAVGCGYIPIAPHLYFPAILDDTNEHERIEGIKLGIELMKETSELWLIGTSITAGMAFELNAAKTSQIPTRLFDEKMQEIYPDTLYLDARITEDYRKAVYGLKFA